MTGPEVAPVYLVVPSTARGVIGPFVDRLAMDPVAAERTSLAAVEYSSFVHELFPLGTPLEHCARVEVSGFSETCFSTTFIDLVGLIDYDRHRLAERHIHARRPIVLLVVDSQPEVNDDWRAAHGDLVGSNGVVVAVLSTCPEALTAAEEMAFPARRVPLMPGGPHVAEAAADRLVQLLGLRGGESAGESVRPMSPHPGS